MEKKKVRLVTRKSPLAMAQTTLCAERVRVCFPDVEVEILPIVTTGDQRTQWSLIQEGGKGLFTRELEEALLSGEADIAVHSAKDIPTEMPDKLTLAGYLPRECAQDVLVYRKDVAVPQTLASSSPRRRTQAKVMFPHAVWTEIRGNVDTRLKKIAAGQADGTFLAAAGLARLGIHEWPGLIFRKLPPQVMVPAAGQGAIGLQCRKGEENIWSVLGDPETERAVCLEREILTELGGGCQVALGVHYTAGQLYLYREDWGNRVVELNWESEQQKRELIKKILTELKAI
jgi:hydroxymethylbilane synthase